MWKRVMLPMIWLMKLPHGIAVPADAVLEILADWGQRPGQLEGFGDGGRQPADRVVPAT